MSTRVTVWHEYRHEKKDETVRAMYPQGMHEALAKHLRTIPGLDIRLATLDEPEHGLTQEVVDSTDVMLWWGHGAHAEVKDEIVDRVQARVLAGMGLIVLHSGHHSKIFKRMMGTTCNLKWRVDNNREILWVTKPGHPVLAGIDDHFILEQEEMYGEYFDVPEPDELLMISSFTPGEVFRSCMTWQRGAGKILYFRPGHETYPSYYNPNVLRIISNAVQWIAPVPGGVVPKGCPRAPSDWLNKQP